MKVLQNKIFIGAACFLLAAVFAFGILPGMYKDRGGTEKIIKVNAEIPAGTKISEELLVETEVGSYGLPESVVKNRDEIVGKFTKTNITPEDIILTSKISDYAANERLDNIFNNGNKLISITLPSIAAGVGNHLRAGDIISLIYYANDKPVVIDGLKNIEVYSVENDDAQNVEAQATEDEEIDRVASTVTLIVSEDQAKEIVNAEYSGKIHAVLEWRRG